MDINIISIFITGLFAGGLTCLAVQGGLLASSLAQQETKKLKDQALKGQALPIIAFLVTRLLAYTLMGLLLGMLGSAIQISLSVRVIMQLLAAIFMIGTALNLLNVHPVFRYFIIQPPKALTRLVKNQSRSKEVFTPALLGALTIFIPCGTTQAMMVFAVSTGSAFLGALVMFTFILGTSPLFFVLGYAAKKLSTGASVQFNRIAAAAIILVALYNLSGTLALAGYNVPFASSQSNKFTTSQSNTTNTVTSATVFITNRGYESDPEVITVKAGSNVTLKLKNTNGAGCMQAFTIPKFGIQRIIPVGKEDEITFTAPNEPQTLPFMCSMGMYRGAIEVI